MTSERRSTGGSLPRLIVPHRTEGEKDEGEVAPVPPEAYALLELLARIVVRVLQKSRYYAVDVVCPKCGEMHRLPKGVWLEDGPADASSLGDYCVSQEDPHCSVVVTREDTSGRCECSFL